MQFTARAFAAVRGVALCGAAFLIVPATSFGQGLPAGAVGRLGGGPALRHGANVAGLALSADGQRVASLGWDNTVKVWDITAGKLLYQTTGTRTNNNVPDLSADGKFLAAPGQNATTLHDLTTSKPLRTVPGNHPRFSPDAKHLATSAYEVGNPPKYRVNLVEFASGKVLRSCGNDATLMQDFAFAPDGNTLAGVGDDSVVYLWDVATGKEVVRCAGHRATVESVAFTPDGKQVVSASHDGTVRFWDAATGKEQRRFGRLAEGLDERAEWASRAVVSPDGERLFVVWGAGSSASVIDLASGRTVRTLRGNAMTGYAPIGRAVSGPAQVMASLSGADGTIHVIDLVSGRERTPAQPPAYLAGLAISSDARTLALGENGTVTLWDVPGGKQRLRLEGAAIPGQTLAFSPDGGLLATGASHDTAVSVWDAATGKEVRQLHGHVSGVQRVWFEADGRSLLVQDNGGVLHRWDPAAGTERARHWLQRGFPQSITSDGRQALLRYYDPLTRVPETRIVDVASGKTLVTLPPDAQGQLSPDGRWLAALGPANDRSVRLASAATGHLVRRIDLALNEPPADGRSGGASFLAFTLDGRSVAAAQGTRTARLFETATGLERRRLTGHTAPIRTAALSPDGRILATASTDGVIFVWDLFSRHEPVPNPLTPTELAAHWHQLVGGDGGKAFASVCILARAPEQALPYLQERLKPVAPAEPQRVARLIAELDNEAFPVREKASEELEKLGDLVGDALRQVLDGKPALETRQRIEKVLEKVDGQQLNADGLRAVRALEVLELVATKEAREAIETIAKGAAGARVTQEAKAALERLSRRSAAP